MDAEAALALVLVGILWVAVGWFGYGVFNRVRFGNWSVPKIKKEQDFSFFVLCLFGGPLSALIAGVIKFFQVLDTLSE